MGKINIKSADEIALMQEGGGKLKRVKNILMEKVAIGVSAMEIESLANELIEKEGAKASFKMVPDYSWATCINVNEGIVHGIPKKEMIFKKGDLVSVDVGIFYKGFHTDTSFTVGLDLDGSTNRFLETGRSALKKAIAQVKVGKHIYDISKAIQDTIEGAGYSAIRALVGHGVGRELHEEPQVPCFVPGEITESPKIIEGMVLAVEVMYAQGRPEAELLSDGWTIATADGKISALFEETVAVTKDGPKVLTA